MDAVSIWFVASRYNESGGANFSNTTFCIEDLPHLSLQSAQDTIRRHDAIDSPPHPHEEQPRISPPPQGKRLAFAMGVIVSRAIVSLLQTSRQPIVRLRRALVARRGRGDRPM